MRLGLLLGSAFTSVLPTKGLGSSHLDERRFFMFHLFSPKAPTISLQGDAMLVAQLYRGGGEGTKLVTSDLPNPRL